MRKFKVAILVSALTVLVSPLPAIDFAHEVMPILTEHCTECHTGEKKKGGLAMHTRAELLAGGESGEAAVPGDADASLFFQLLSSEDEDEWMPPKGDRVPPEQVEVLRRWVDAGMPWEEGIMLGESAWEPPLRPRVVELPPARNGRDHPIDRILDADLAARGKAVPAPASEAALLRRATLDVIGLLPTPEELEAFLRDASPTKYEDKVDALLADEIGYADHWLTTWNDLLRNDYTGTGYITGGRKQITDWLYAALRNNKPYDQFVRELIAPTEASAGFIEGIQWRGDVNASQTREIQFAQNTSQVFLGLNMKCASCHDSFIDRWTLEEAYNLAAITAEKPLELNRCDKPTGVMARPKWIFPELGDIDPEAPRAERLEQLAGLMTHPENGRFTRTIVNRIWERLMGRGIVHPVDAMDTRPWNEDLLDYLAVRFAEDGHDLRKFIRFVMTSQAYRSRTVVLEREPGEDYAYAGPVAKRMSAEQFIDAIWQITEGNPARAEAGVKRFVEAQDAETAESVQASWLWHAGETGTKSQMRKSFTLAAEPSGATVLATCDNAFTMRINGVEVAASQNWEAPVYREIAGFLRAGENLVEVDAEMFGGAAGFVAQLAITTADGSQLIATDTSWEARPPEGEWAAARVIVAHGEAPWGNVLRPGKSHPVRAALVQNDFLMRSLGRPNREQVVTSRPAELTTLQAIDLANGEILAGYLREGAKRLLTMGRDGSRLAQWVYRFGLSRAPTEGEELVLAEALGDGDDPVVVEDLLWLVFMQPEFQMIR
jgi:hypothetical protein